MHLSCIRTLSFLFLDCDCVMFPLSLSLSLSLSLINCAWHLSTNPLQFGTLLVQSLLLLLIHPLFTFGSVMGRPSKTSLRTFKDVTFIQNAMSFCQTFLTLLYLVSFWLRDGNLFVRYPWGALSWLQYTWYRYLCTLVCHDTHRYTYRSHSKSYIRDTTCPKVIASWLPQLSASEDCVQRRVSVSFQWDTFHMGWALKHRMVGLCKRSKIP